MPATASDPGRRNSLPIRWTWGSAPDEGLQALARQLEEGRLPDDAGLIKRGDRRAVWALPQVAGGVLLKHFRIRGWEPLLFLVRPSRGAAEYCAALQLTQLGVNTPSAIGFGERRRRGLLLEAWSMTRLVPDASTVGDVLGSAASTAGASIRSSSCAAICCVTGKPCGAEVRVCSARPRVPESRGWTTRPAAAW
jgi:hypothetical protein